METSPLTAAQNSAVANASRPSLDTTESGLSADFETFLNLLTAQLNNQDPLSPLDSTQFVAQLAQFSSVEQQVQSNATLSQILEKLGGGSTGLAEWLGIDVEGPATQRFEGAPIEIAIPADERADVASLVVFNAAGSEIYRQPVDPTLSAHVWTGSTSAGTVAPTGDYRVAIERSAGGEKLPDGIPTAFSRVVEARLADSGTELILTNGAIVPASEVRSVRAPSGTG